MMKLSFREAAPRRKRTINGVAWFNDGLEKLGSSNSTKSTRMAQLAMNAEQASKAGDAPKPYSRGHHVGCSSRSTPQNST